MADKIKQITDVLDMLAEDTSIPRNIRKGATDAKARLLDTKEAMDVRATGAIVILDDLANDPNIPLHGRTIIWNVISQLEFHGAAPSAALLRHNVQEVLEYLGPVLRVLDLGMELHTVDRPVDASDGLMRTGVG